MSMDADKDSQGNFHGAIDSPSVSPDEESKLNRDEIVRKIRWIR